MESQDAKVTMENEPEEIRMSTDDLVFMLGEAAVRDRQNLKRLTYLDKQVGAARKELLETKSLAEGYKQKLDAFEKIRESIGES